MNNSKSTAFLPPMVVSRALGEFTYEDGKKLGKAQVRRGRYGPEELGGYRVSRGVHSGEVAVRYIAPDDLAESLVEVTRDEFLTLYTDILTKRGYVVRRYGYGLAVSKPTAV